MNCITYFPKKIRNFRWEVWFRNLDNSPDLYNGSTEWKAIWGTRIYRKTTAMRLAQDLQSAWTNARYTAINKQPEL